MANFVLPSKLVSERITVRFEFMDIMPWGDTVSSAVTRVSVLTGVDLYPKYMVRGPAVISGTQVSQKLHGGTPGVIYEIICEVVSSSGGLFKHVVKLAILPTGAIAPPLYATAYTSLPYPTEYVETLATETTLLLGILDAVLFEIFPAEYIDSTTIFVSGDLRGLVDIYTATESLDTHTTFTLGSLRAILQQTVNVESINTGTQLYLGFIDEIVIQYQNLNERLDTQTTLLNGTLT